MWNWYVSNGIWILITSALILVLLLVARVQLQNLARKKQPVWSGVVFRVANLAIIIFGIILLLIAISSLASILLSQSGENSILTPLSVKNWLLQHGIVIIIIIVVSYLAYRFLNFLIPEVIDRSIQARGRRRRAREDRIKRAQTLSSIVSGTVGVVIFLAALFMILSEIGINITPLLAGAGVVGIAVGFGAQSLVKDIFSGIFIILEDHYVKGDVVKIADITGLVEDINLRRTVLRDLDGVVHIVPNGEIRVASNYTKDWARVNINIPVAYGEDLDKVIEVLNRVGAGLAEDEAFRGLINTPPQVLRVDNFGDSAIEIKVIGETKPMQQWVVTGEFRKRVKKAFDEAGIEIPWPHIKLYFGQNPEDRPDLGK